MAISHVKSNTIPDWTGTVTVGNSTGGTQTVAASDLVRPSDWNSAHNQYYTLSGNTNNASTASGTNVVLQGVGAVTLVGSTGTIGISAPTFANSNNMTFGTNAGTVTASFNPVNIGISNIGNTAGTTGTFDGAGLQYVFAGGNNVTLSQSSNGSSVTLSIAAAGGGGGGTTLSAFRPYADVPEVVGQIGNGSIFFAPVDVVNPFQHDRIVMGVHYTQSTAATLTVSVTAQFGLYTKNVSSLSLLSSTSGSWTINGSGTASSANNSGNRHLTFGWTNTVNPNNYYIAVQSSTSTAGVNSATLSNLNGSQINSTHSGLMGVASNTTNQRVQGLGVYSAASAALPGSVALTQIRGNSSAFQRPPIIYFTSGYI